MAVEENGQAKSATLSTQKIVATRLHERGTNLLSLKLLVE